MNILQDIIFLNPEYFWGLILIPVILYFFYKKQKQGLEFSKFSDLKKIFKKSSLKFYATLFLL
jgi:hypothetical protein